MTSILLQLFFAWAYIALLCYLAYKVFCFLADKLVDLCFDSPKFRTGFCIFLSLAFCGLGLLQLSDFLKGTAPLHLTLFFPLSIGLAGIMLYLGIRSYRLEINSSILKPVILPILEALSDSDYQQRSWIKREPPNHLYTQAECIDDFFMLSKILKDSEDEDKLTDDEMEMLQGLSEQIDHYKMTVEGTLIARLEHPDWIKIQKQSGELLKTIEKRLRK